MKLRLYGKYLKQKLSRKAQIRITETVAILFIFFILIALGMSFYGKYRTVALEEKQEEILQGRAVRTTLRSLFLPELLCSRGDAEPEENCVDMLKVRHFQEKLEPHSNTTYFDLFSFSKISVHQLYPSTGEWVIYSNKKPNAEKSERTYFVVALRDDVAGDKGVPAYGYGYVQVEVYS